MDSNYLDFKLSCHVCLLACKVCRNPKYTVVDVYDVVYFNSALKLARLELRRAAGDLEHFSLFTSSGVLVDRQLSAWQCLKKCKFLRQYPDTRPFVFIAVADVGNKVMNAYLLYQTGAGFVLFFAC